MELDSLPRFKLSDFREFFKKCKEKRVELPPLQDEYDYYPRYNITLQGTVTLKGTEYAITAETITNIPEGNFYTFEICSFLFEWESYDGEKWQQRVLIQTLESNLDLPPVRYFLCPYTMRKCRKLYVYGNTIASRYALPYTYRKQNRSKYWRDFEKILNVMDSEDLVRDYGKETYRGKPTPYGKKLMKQYGKIVQSRALIEAMFGGRLN